MPDHSSLSDLLFRAIVATAAHRTFFTTLTTLTAGLVSIGALWLYRDALPSEKWLRSFGRGFALFALQYFFPSAAVVYFLLLSQPYHDVPALSFLASLASCFNNVFFLAAARSLLRKGPAVPWWSVAAAALATFLDTSNVLGHWNRVADAAFSIFALGGLGFAMFTNISPRRQRANANIALFGGFLYALLNIVYALIPPVTEGSFWPALRTLLTSELQGTGQTPKWVLDTNIIAFALLLKLLIAAGAFLLILRTFVTFSPVAFVKSLTQVNLLGADFFVGEGLLRLIGQTFEADRAAISFRLPGLNTQEVAWWEWFPNSHSKKPRITPLPRSKRSPEGRVLETGTPYERSNVSWADPFSRLSPEGGPAPPSKLVVPIRYRGSVVGTLGADWSTELAFTPTAVHQLTFLANLFAPAIDHRRRLAAIYSCVRELEHIDFPLMEDIGGYRAMTAKLATLLYHTLSPMSVGLTIRAGFRPVWAAVGEDGEASGYLENQPTNRISAQLHRFAGCPPSDLLVHRTAIEVRESKLGTLSMAWPKPGAAQGRTRPFVFPDFLLRRSFAALIRLTLLDSAHVGLTNLLNKLQLDLQETSIKSVEDWFRILEDVVKESGLRWLVATDLTLHDERGHHDYVAIVRMLLDQQKDTQDQDLTLRRFPLIPPQLGTHHVLRLRIPSTGGHVWLGVGNRHFDWEVRPDSKNISPWHIFLDRLAATADSALSAITAKEEAARLQSEAETFRSFFITSADVVGFFHECRNIARGFTFTLQSLQGDWQNGFLSAPPKIAPSIENSITSLLKAAQRLYGLADALMKFRTDARRLAYPLAEAVQAVQDIVQYILTADDGAPIAFDVFVDRSILVTTPLHVAQQALLSLVSNSIDAIRSSHFGSSIRVEAKAAGPLVECRVIDDGPGVPTSVIRGIFKLGVSTKTGTGGKGLFLIQNLLREHQAEVSLESSSRGRTVFLVSLPRPSERESDHE